MRSGGGKAKGASFERGICKALSLWVSHGKQEDCFWRSAMSGGRSTVAYRKGKRLAAQAGDITSIHPKGNAIGRHFIIECKNYKSLDYHGLITGKGKLIEFWLEARRNAAKYFDRFPMLIAKQNMLPPIVVLTMEGRQKLGLSTTDTLFVVFSLKMYAFSLDTFLEKAVPPK